MKKIRLLIGIALCAALLLLAAAALAESARVVTRGGHLNMRKEPDDKAKLVDTVPNRSMVEVLEVDGEWAKVVYQKKTGYVHSAYLKLPSLMVGKTVYSDGDMILMRSAPEAGSAPVCPVSGSDPVRVDRIEGDWACVWCGERRGYVEVRAFSYQYEAPVSAFLWIREPAVMARDADLMDAPDKTAVKTASLAKGQSVTVTLVKKDVCLILTEDGCGYVPAEAVALCAPEDSEDRLEGLSPMDAAQQAEEALRKKYKTFAKEKLYCVPAVYLREAGANVYRCVFLDQFDRCLYDALVSADTGKALFTASYAAFAAPEREKTLLPAGRIELALSAETLAVGDVLDITVQAWTEYACSYSLDLDGATVFSGEDTDHFRASYRPRQAGAYVLTVTVTDEEGRTETASAPFLTDPAAEGDGAAPSVYSQKDGWWKDKKYRHSNLQKSGCAIFTLASALQRMGHNEAAALPEVLAVTYANFLLKGEGTSNERLINKAARDFGFKTRTALYTDPTEIVNFLRQGGMFTFAVARGHIALVTGLSEDGEMATVADSAPSATYERIVDCGMYYRLHSGIYRQALSPEDLPGARWYFETGEYGGLEYYLPVSYLAKRGVRLILPLSAAEE